MYKYKDSYEHNFVKNKGEGGWVGVKSTMPAFWVP